MQVDMGPEMVSKHGDERRIPNLPLSFYYIPNFITEAEEASILQKIPGNRWTTLSHRRLQAHPSALTPSNTLLAAPLPLYLSQPIILRMQDLGVFAHTPHQTPNHVLINEYKRGEGIMPHEDGDAYADVVATVSLGGSLCLKISPKPGEGQNKPEESAQWKLPTRIFQEPRSLLITTGSAYKELMHGIEEVEVDENLSPDTVANWDLLGEKPITGSSERSTRISLTYRDVLKVSRAASKVFGMGRR